MECSPKGSEEPSSLRGGCSVCGAYSDLCELPGRREKYCFECSADVATSILLTTEIDAANKSGEETAGLVSEFLQLGRRMLARAQWE
jgi:hypothetical protein